MLRYTIIITMMHACNNYTLHHATGQQHYIDIVLQATKQRITTHVI